MGSHKVSVVGRAVAMVLLASLVSGCATSRRAGIRTATRHVSAIEKIAADRHVKLADFEGVALVSLGKLGAFGLGVMGKGASVYLKQQDTSRFGPPAFVSYGGVSAGLAYVGVNFADCLILFEKREDAERFAKRSIDFNFSNEASLLIWGRKQMTVPGGMSASDGAGLSVGAIELELLFGGKRKRLHRNLYQADATVDRVLVGDVTIPEELRIALDRLNALMTEE